MSTVITDNYKRTPLSELRDKFNEVRYDGARLLRAYLETVEGVTNGEALMLDPTHPAVTFLEMSAVSCSNAIQESIGILRTQYPILAETASDLYRHMSDTDYLNRFATPSTTTITFGMLLSDVQFKMEYDATERASRAVIPRDTRITVDGVTYMMPYPVVIRRYDTGAIQITYDSSITSPLMVLRNSVITPAIRRSPKADEWLFFSVDVVQVNYEVETYPLDKTYYFKKSIAYKDEFCYARAYLRNEKTNGEWVEIKTTHSDQTFDPRQPTALLKVMEGVLEIEIPVLYFTNDAMTGNFRVVVYSTKGNMVLNLLDYNQNQFSVDPTPINQERDANRFSNVLSKISYYVYGSETSQGGKSGLSLEELRSRVIYHTTGPQELPITNVQLTADGSNNGFEIVRMVNVLTNRQYLATRRLPTPTNVKLITPANIGILTFADVLQDIMDNENVISHGRRYTIKSNAVFKNNNGVVTMLRKYELDEIKGMGRTALVQHVNSNEYHYTPFYYVMDETLPEFELRAYMLDQPYAKDFSFERQNETVQLFVNSGKYVLTKTPEGFVLDIQTYSGNVYKDIADSLVGVQLMFYPDGEEKPAYINGELVGHTETRERLYRFKIQSNHELDAMDRIAITNARVEGMDNYKAWVKLEQVFNILHYTSDLPNGYVRDTTDDLLGKFMLPALMSGNSHEKLTVHFGDALRNLWRRSHSYKLDRIYKAYDTDIPLFYEEDVFDPHPDGTVFDIVDGQFVYRYKHRKGDPVMQDGVQVLRHKKGDTMLDVNGNPIEISQIATGREMDILVVDGRYFFADDKATVEYRDEVARVTAGWITGDIQNLKDSLLEQTEIFFYPKTTLGDVKVRIENNTTTFVSAEQRFKVNLYVKSAILNDERIKEKLRRATVSLLDAYVALRIVNMTTIRKHMKDMYGESVVAFNIAGLGGSENYEIVTTTSEEKRLCLKKELTILPDMSMFVQDAVAVEFYRADTDGVS